MIKKTADLSEQQPVIGLVLELEFMLFPGRQLMFDAFSSVLKQNQISLDQTLFSRYCLRRTIEKSLSGLLPALGKKGLATENITAKIKRQFESSLDVTSTLPTPGLPALLKKAAEKNIKIGLLSFLPQENANQLMARLSLDQQVCLQVMKKEADDLPTPDGWLSLLKVLKVVPRCAVALVDGAMACKSALAVGMRCVVFPDRFTAWQDFGGADIVTENISDLKLDDIVALLTPAHFREHAK